MNCELCGEPMPAGEEMFKFHGYSGPCPKPPLPSEPEATLSSRWQELFWALPPGEMRHKLRSLEIDIGRALSAVSPAAGRGLLRDEQATSPAPENRNEPLDQPGDF